MVENQNTPDQLLQKGIRAARRDQKSAARKLLAQVVQTDPDNEEAWLWLSRVADTPQQRADCLNRVIAINPNNQWAADQLADLQKEPGATEPAPAAEKAAPQTPDPAPPAELALEQIKCPKCGSAVEPHSGSAAKTLVCSHCHSILDLSREQAALIGKAKRARPSAPIRPGMQATFDGELYQVIGWLRYRGADDEDHWYWDEWLLASSKGGFRWLSYDDEQGFVLQKKITPSKPFDPHTARYISVPGGRARVTERAKATIIAIDGELSWKAKIGEKTGYFDAKRGDKHYSAEYSKDSLELFEGQALDDLLVWQAFGRQDLAEQVTKHQEKQGYYRLLAIACLFLALLGGLVTLYGLTSGRQLFKTDLQLTRSETDEVRIGPFTVSHPNRIHRVTLKSQSLPTNSWSYVEVAGADDRENEFYLFGAEFWDETGRDSDGPWHERDLKDSFLFRPDSAGEYYLYLLYSESSAGGLASLNVCVTVEDKIWQWYYPGIFAVIAGGLCAIFYILSSVRPDVGQMLRALAQEKKEK